MATINTRVDLYLSKLVLGTSLVGLLILSLLFFCYALGKLVSDELIGHLDQAILLQMAFIRTLIAAPQLIPTAFYFGAIIALNRLNKSSELLVLSALGWGDWRLSRMVVLIGISVGLLLMLSAHWLRPLAYYQFGVLKSEILKTNQIVQIPPGTFVNLLGGEWVIGSEARNTETKAFINLFLHQKTESSKRMITATSGTIEKPNREAPYLIELHNGHIYDFNEIGQTYRESHFERMNFSISDTTPQTFTRHHRSKASSTLARSDSLVEIAEFHWRLSLPFGFVLLMMLVMPITKGHPRQASNLPLIIGVVIYTLVYYTFNVLGEWIEQGVISPLPGYWWLWLAVALGALVLYNRMKIRI